MFVPAVDFEGEAEFGYSAGVKPEAMYFTTFDGQRTAFMVFDLPDASGIPPFAEPFFRELNASVQLAPAMNGDDLQKGLSQLG
jgi:hypothetical protein